MVIIEHITGWKMDSLGTKHSLCKIKREHQGITNNVWITECDYKVGVMKECSGLGDYNN